VCTYKHDTRDYVSVMTIPSYDTTVYDVIRSRDVGTANRPQRGSSILPPPVLANVQY